MSGATLPPPERLLAVLVGASVLLGLLLVLCRIAPAAATRRSIHRGGAIALAAWTVLGFVPTPLARGWWEPPRPSEAPVHAERVAPPEGTPPAAIRPVAGPASRESVDRLPRAGRRPGIAGIESLRSPEASVATEPLARLRPTPFEDTGPRPPEAATEDRDESTTMPPRPSPPLARPEVAAEAALAWPHRLLMLWAAGGIAMLAVMGLGLARLRWLLHRARPADAALVREWRSSPHAARLRDCRLLVSPDAVVPFCGGLRRRFVVLPRRWATPGHERIRAAIFAHESAHLQHADPSWQWCAGLLSAVWWFHPLWWWLRRQQRFTSELLADQDAVRSIERRCYAESMIALSQAPTRRGAFPGVAGALAGASEFYRRMNMVLCEPSPRSPSRHTRTLSALAVLTGLGLVVLAFGASPAEAQDPAPIQDTRTEPPGEAARPESTPLEPRPEASPRQESSEVAKLRAALTSAEARIAQLEAALHSVQASKSGLGQSSLLTAARSCLELVQRHAELQATLQRTEMQLGQSLQLAEKGFVTREEVVGLELSLESTRRQLSALQLLVDSERAALHLELKGLKHERAAAGSEDPAREARFQARVLRLEAQLRVLDQIR